MSRMPAYPGAKPPATRPNELLTAMMSRSTIIDEPDNTSAAAFSSSQSTPNQTQQSGYKQRPLPSTPTGTSFGSSEPAVRSNAPPPPPTSQAPLPPRNISLGQSTPILPPQQQRLAKPLPPPTKDDLLRSPPVPSSHNPPPPPLPPLPSAPPPPPPSHLYNQTPASDPSMAGPASIVASKASLDGILKHALRASKLSETQISQIMLTINQLKPADAAVLDDGQIRNLLQVFYESQDLIAQQKLDKILTYVQTTFRMKREYRNYQLLRRSGEIPRLMIIKQLYRDESLYFSNIRRAFTGYYSELMVAAGSSTILGINSISISDLKELFGKFDQLYNFHQEIINTLDNMMSTWPYIHGSIGKIFSSRLPYLKCYIDFTANSPNAFAALERLEKNDRFVQIISDSCRATGSLDIRSLLNYPLNRLGVYESLMGLILSQTKRGHHDYLATVDALKGIQNTKRATEDALESSLARVSILSILRRIDKADGLFETLIAEYSKLVREDDMQQVSSRNQGRHLFLFTDRLLICSQAQRGIHTLKSSLYLNKFTVRDVPDSQSQKNAFEIVEESMILTASSPELKKAWLQSYEKALKESESKQVFGLPLVKTSKRESDQPIPLLVTDCVEQLRSRGLLYPGIFRISGDSTIISQFKSRLNKGRPVYLDECEISIISGLLKLWFLELPEPVFPHALFADLCAFPESKSALDKFAYMKQVVRKLPPYNHAILKYLFKFLNEITTFSTQNLMDSHNLGIALGPSLTRPVEVTLENARDIPKANTCVSFIIEQQELIFID